MSPLALDEISIFYVFLADHVSTNFVENNLKIYSSFP